MSEYPIQIHPEVARLTAENGLLRDELARLVVHIEELHDPIAPNLWAIYQTKLGHWELQVLIVQFDVAELKRQIELVQAALNRGERPDLASIDRELEIERQAWHIRIEEARQRIEAAKARLNSLFSAEENEELKRLYRALVKKLHPDLNPNLTDEQRRLWQRVQQAFAAADLAELRALALFAEIDADGFAPPTTLESLRAEQQRLRREIDELLKRIEEIESRPPFTLRDRLADDAWIASRRAELEKTIEELQSQRHALESHLQQLLSQRHDRPWFSQN